MARPPGSNECGAEKKDENGIHDCAEQKGHSGKHKCWCKKVTW